MRNNVRLNYSKYPEQLESGIVKIDNDRDIKLSVNKDRDGIFLEIKEDLFGAENNICINLDFEMSKDIYRLMYLLIRQLDRNQKCNVDGQG